MQQVTSFQERLYGKATIGISAKLGQLVKTAMFEEIETELQEFATFMTQVIVVVSFVEGVTESGSNSGLKCPFLRRMSYLYDHCLYYKQAFFSKKM